MNLSTRTSTPKARHSYRPVSPEIFRDRLTWFERACAHAQDPDKSLPPDHSLLLTGLRADDNPRWEIGVLDAELRKDQLDDSPFVVFKFAKPEKRRTPTEEQWTERWFDPEAAFVLQAHLFFGNKLAMQLGEGNLGGIYHYPVIYLPNRHYDHILRLVIDAPVGRLAKQDQKDFHDLRRRNLGRTITQAQAAAIYGNGQKQPRMVRDDIIAASLSAHRRRHGASGLGFTAQTYEDMLRRGYDLLDRHRLKTDTAKP